MVMNPMILCVKKSPSVKAKCFKIHGDQNSLPKKIRFCCSTNYLLASHDSGELLPLSDHPNLIMGI